MDAGNHRIQRFDSLVKYLSKWGTEGDGNGQFRQPQDVEVDTKTGAVYVLDPGNNTIQKFNDRGGFLLKWDWSFQSPGPIAYDSNNKWLYVADRDNRRVLKFDSFGRLLTEIGVP